MAEEEEGGGESARGTQRATDNSLRPNNNT
jgi:hypothetical protein